MEKSKRTLAMELHYLSNSTFISDTANSVHVAKMTSALASVGVDVTLHTYEGYGSSSEVKSYYGLSDRVDLRRYDPGEKDYIKVLRKLQSRLPVGSLTSLLEGWVVVRAALPTTKENEFYSRNAEWLIACLSRDSRFIFESHCPPRNIIERSFQRYLFAHPGFSKLVLISDNLRDSYLKIFPRLEQSKIIVAHDAANELPETVRKKSVRPSIGYVGHLYPGRGGELMLEIARSLEHCDFHIVGGRYEDLQRLKGMNPSGNVIFHGHKPPAEIPKFYSGFDIVLAPYQNRVAVAGGRGDTVSFMSPLKIFEYMSSGKAIIASDLPALREILDDKENSLLVQYDRVDLWVDAINSLLENERFRLLIGENARKKFKEFFTWEARARKIMNAVDFSSCRGVLMLSEGQGSWPK